MRQRSQESGSLCSDVSTKGVYIQESEFSVLSAFTSSVSDSINLQLQNSSHLASSAFQLRFLFVMGDHILLLRRESRKRKDEKTSLLVFPETLPFIY